MRRRLLALVVFVIALVSAGPAQADSTTTKSLGPGESMRSSPDTAPSAATPVIVTVTVRSINSITGPPPATTAVTVTLKDRPGSGPGDNPEGPSGYEYMGANVNVSSSEQFTELSVVFEVEGSLELPGFLTEKTGGSSTQFFSHHQRPGEPALTGFNYMADAFQKVERFGDGDFRFTPDPRSGAGSYDILQQSFYALPGAFGDSLPDALAKGVHVFLKTNYAATVAWKVKVSAGVAKTLKLKSTTIASKTFAKPGGEQRRVRLTAAARKALKRYKKVAVTLHSRAEGPSGQVIVSKKKLTLKTPESELA